MTDYDPSSKPLCSADCWHYDSFGGKEGCGQKHGGWGGWPEPVKPGEHCLHPEAKDVDNFSFDISGLRLCAALEGSVIEGGPYDNVSLAKILVNLDS